MHHFVGPGPIDHFGLLKLNADGEKQSLMNNKKGKCKTASLNDSQAILFSLHFITFGNKRLESLNI